MDDTTLLRRYWQNKTVLITGASSGIGRALVERLAPYHVTFGLLARRKEKMIELAESLKHGNSRFWIKTCDVQDREDVYDAVDEFKEYAGRIDVAWVNAGMSVPSSMKKWDWELVESCIQTNLLGALYTTKACLDVMKERGKGTLVGIGSVASMRGLPTRSVYSTTKIGLEYAFDSLAVEVPHVQFTIIHPGFINTPFLKKPQNRIFIQPVEMATEKMIIAVAKKKARYIFPWQMALIYGLARTLPSSWYRFLARRFINLAKKE